MEEQGGTFVQYNCFIDLHSWNGNLSFNRAATFVVHVTCFDKYTCQQRILPNLCLWKTLFLLLGKLVRNLYHRCNIFIVIGEYRTWSETTSSCYCNCAILDWAYQIIWLFWSATRTRQVNINKQKLHSLIVGKWCIVAYVKLLNSNPFLFLSAWLCM